MSNLSIFRKVFFCSGPPLCCKRITPIWGMTSGTNPPDRAVMWNLYLILSCTLAPCKYHITAYHCLLLELCTWIWNMRGITELEHTYLEVKVSRVVYEISAGSLVWYHMCTHLFPSSSDNGQTCHLQNNDSVRYECTTTCHLQIMVRNVGAIACCVGT